MIFLEPLLRNVIFAVHTCQYFMKHLIKCYSFKRNKDRELKFTILAKFVALK